MRREVEPLSQWWEHVDNILIDAFLYPVVHLCLDERHRNDVGSIEKVDYCKVDRKQRGHWFRIAWRQALNSLNPVYLYLWSIQTSGLVYVLGDKTGKWVYGLPLGMGYLRGSLPNRMGFRIWTPDRLDLTGSRYLASKSKVRDYSFSGRCNSACDSARRSLYRGRMGAPRLQCKGFGTADLCRPYLRDIGRPSCTRIVQARRKSLLFRSP